MPINLSSLIAGAIIGFASAAALRWWQYRRDLWLGRVERLCDVIEKAAESATSYWLEIPNGKGNSGSAREKMEALNLGFQIKFDGFLVSVQERWAIPDQEEINNLSAQFTDGLTGGNFGSARKSIDIARARSVQQSASDLIVKIRVSSDKALTFGGLISYLWRKHISAYFSKFKVSKK